MTKKPTSDGFDFENNESFGLFIEGLRALQCYGHEAAQDSPRKPLLDWFIAQAVARLRENINHYPDDFLPRYYLGVAVTTLNQHFYVEKLNEVSDALVAWGRYLGLRDLKNLTAKELSAVEDDEIAQATITLRKTNITDEMINRAKSDAQEALDLRRDPWPLLHEADFHFKYLQEKLDPGASDNDGARAEFLRNVIYNRAEVFSRLGRAHAKDIENAIEMLDKIPAAKDLQLSFFESLQLRGRGNEVRDSSSKDKSELYLQSRTLLYSLQVRQELHQTKPSTEHLKMLEEFEEKIRQSESNPLLNTDIEADYWTKLGYVRYEIAITPEVRPHKSCDQTLVEAEENYLQALTRKTNWNPSQIYLALAYRVHSGVAEAMGNATDKKRYTEKANKLFESLLGTCKRPVEPIAGQWKIQGSVSAVPDYGKPAEA